MLTLTEKLTVLLQMTPWIVLVVSGMYWFASREGRKGEKTE